VDYRGFDTDEGKGGCRPVSCGAVAARCQVHKAAIIDRRNAPAHRVFHSIRHKNAHNATPQPYFGRELDRVTVTVARLTNYFNFVLRISILIVSILPQFLH
jgi:hypothetical protein